MSKHIDGPWQATEKFDRDGNSFWIIETTRECDGWEIADVRCDVPSHGDNAKLMAVAPELLKALVYARRFLRKDEHDTDYVDSIIAKARGEQC